MKVESYEPRNLDEKKVVDGPITETTMTMSKDGKWFIHKTIITDIKSVNYLTKVLENKQD